MPRGSTAPAASRTRGWLPAAAAVVILAGLGAAWLLQPSDDDPEQLIVPVGPVTTTTTTTTTPTGTTTSTLPHTIDWVDWRSMPEVGIAVTSQGAWDLYDIDGTLLDAGLHQPDFEATDGPEVRFPHGTGPVPIDPAEVPADCDSAFGGGGVRLALCEGAPGQPRVIDVVDLTGATSRLTGAPFDDTSPDGGVAGHWRWALPSPDGRWTLAQWSSDCGAPEAFLTPLPGGGVPLHLDPVPAGITSRGLGWTADGRAIIELPVFHCGTTADAPGVYLLDPETREMTLLVELTDAAETSYLWHHRPYSSTGVPRLAVRAFEELGLEHGTVAPQDANGAAVFEGASIGVGAATPGDDWQPPPGVEVQRLPLLHGEAAIVDPVEGDHPVVQFTCGPRTWWLTWLDEGTAEVDSMLLLAEALVPHLYCTLPPR